MTKLKVVPLRKAMGCENVSETLRLIADQIEAGEYADWPITTAVLVCGSESARPEADDEMWDTNWSTHGMGPRNSPFICKGLLMSILAQGFER